MKSATLLTSVDPVAGFHALSDPIRLDVLRLLRQEELCVCDLCERLEISQSKLSFHLKTLKDAGLVTARQQGRWIYYRIHGDTLTQLEIYLVGLHQAPFVAPRPNCSDLPCG